MAFLILDPSSLEKYERRLMKLVSIGGDYFPDFPELR